MLLQGVKPTQNRDNNEYRRVTQPPLIDYKLLKRNVTDIRFNATDVLKQELAEKSNEVKELAKEEGELRKTLKDLEKKNAYFAMELVNPITRSGDVGIGKPDKTKGRVLQEKVGERGKKTNGKGVGGR